MGRTRYAGDRRKVCFEQSMGGRCDTVRRLLQPQAPKLSIVGIRAGHGSSPAADLSRTQHGLQLRTVPAVLRLLFVSTHSRSPTAAASHSQCPPHSLCPASPTPRISLRPEPAQRRRSDAPHALRSIHPRPFPSLPAPAFPRHTSVQPRRKDNQQKACSDSAAPAGAAALCCCTL